MLHLDHSAQRRQSNSIIVPGAYNLAISFPSAVLIVERNRRIWAHSPTEQHWVPQILPSDKAPRNSASEFGNPSDTHVVAMLSCTLPQGATASPAAGPTPTSFLLTKYGISIAFWLRKFKGQSSRCLRHRELPRDWGQTQPLIARLVSLGCDSDGISK